MLGHSVLTAFYGPIPTDLRILTLVRREKRNGTFRVTVNDREDYICIWTLKTQKQNKTRSEAGALAEGQPVARG